MRQIIQCTHNYDLYKFASAVLENIIIVEKIAHLHLSVATWHITWLRTWSRQVLECQMSLLVSMSASMHAEGTKVLSVGLEERPNLSTILASIAYCTECVAERNDHLSVAKCYLWKGNTLPSPERNVQHLTISQRVCCQTWRKVPYVEDKFHDACDVTIESITKPSVNWCAEGVLRTLHCWIAWVSRLQTPSSSHRSTFRALYHRAFLSVASASFSSVALLSVIVIFHTILMFWNQFVNGV